MSDNVWSESWGHKISCFPWHGHNISSSLLTMSHTHTGPGMSEVPLSLITRKYLSKESRSSNFYTFWISVFWDSANVTVETQIYSLCKISVNEFLLLGSNVIHCLGLYRLTLFYHLDIHWKALKQFCKILKNGYDMTSLFPKDFKKKSCNEKSVLYCSHYSLKYCLAENTHSWNKYVRTRV